MVLVVFFPKTQGSTKTGYLKINKLYKIIRNISKNLSLERKKKKKKIFENNCRMILPRKKKSILQMRKNENENKIKIK